MGTDCVLMQVGSPFYQEFAAIDSETTTKDHGYRVTGYCLYKKNRVVEHILEGDFSHTKTDQ